MLIEKIQERIQTLSSEAHKLHNDKKLLEKKLADIDVRTHQVVGALHELQILQSVAIKEQEAAAAMRAAAPSKVSQPQEVELETSDESETEDPAEIVDITLSADDLQS